MLNVWTRHKIHFDIEKKNPGKESRNQALNFGNGRKTTNLSWKQWPQWFCSLRQPRGDHVINPNGFRVTSLSLCPASKHVVGYRKWNGQTGPVKPINNRKLQQWMQKCCGNLHSLKVIMVHARVSAVRRWIDVKIKNDLATQGLEVVKSVKMLLHFWGQGKDW